MGLFSRNTDQKKAYSIIAASGVGGCVIGGFAGGPAGAAIGILVGGSAGALVGGMIGAYKY